MSTVRLFPVTVELRGDTGIPDLTVIARLNALLERTRQRSGEALPYPIDVVVRPFVAGPPAEPPLAKPAPPPWTPDPDGSGPLVRRRRKPKSATRSR